MMHKEIVYTTEWRDGICEIRFGPGRDEEIGATIAVPAICDYEESKF